jgi:hypothetical protein
MALNTKIKPEHCAQLTGVVSQILAHPDGVWAEILIEGAEELCREIRVHNPLKNEDGSETMLKKGDRVTITIRAAL